MSSPSLALVCVVSSLLESEVESQENVKAFLAEIEMMKRVSKGNNSHVVKMVGCVTLSIPLALILEYVPQGNLRDYLRTARRKVGISCLKAEIHAHLNVYFPWAVWYGDGK